MLTMQQKAFLKFTITLSVIFVAVGFLPAFSHEVSLVTSPNGEAFHVLAGQPFNVTCKGSSDDKEKFTSLKWLNQKGQIIPEGIPGTTKAEQNSLSLIFKDPKQEESGVYKCIATYGGIQTLQKTVSIIFSDNRPVFESTFEKITALEKTRLEVLCSAVGELPILYEWYNQYEDKIPDTSNSPIFVSDVANGSVLIVPTVTSEHAGLYTCSASNNHGLSSKIYEITVLLSEDDDTFRNDTISIREVSVVNVTARSVTFDFYITGPVEEIIVKYQEWSERKTYYSTFTYGSDCYEIKGLIPAGSYHFNFRTTPSNDTVWSRSYQVILKPDKPDVIFRTIDAGAVKLEWFLSVKDIMRGTIDRHEISYFTLQMEEGTRWVPSSCDITIQIPRCSSSSYIISGLNQRVYYEIQLRAHTSSGYSEPYLQKIYFE